MTRCTLAAELDLTTALCAFIDEVLVTSTSPLVVQVVGLDDPYTGPYVEDYNADELRAIRDAIDAILALEGT